jgi:YD repeat-containing protein
VSFTSVNTTTGQSTKTSSTTNTYQWWDGAVQSTISYDSDTGDSGNAIWTTNFTYNGLGQLTKTQINDGHPRRAAGYLELADYGWAGCWE